MAQVLLVCVYLWSNLEAGMFLHHNVHVKLVSERDLDHVFGLLELSVTSFSLLVHVDKNNYQLISIHNSQKY